MSDAEIEDPTMNEDEATTIAVAETTEVAETTVVAETTDFAETTVVAETTEVAETSEAADNTEDGGETMNSGINQEETTAMDEIMEEAGAAPVAAGSAKNTEESTVVPVPKSEENEDAPAADAKEKISQEQTGESTETMADATVQPPNETESPAKATKKRVRRVGRTPTRKIAKLEEKIVPSMDVDVGDNNNADVAAAAAAVDAATAAIGAIPEAVGAAAMGATSTIDIAPPPANQGVLSKHDEKWHGMFQKLTEFKDRNKHTLVPQCYSEDPR
jgi:hypothetical protein